MGVGGAVGVSELRGAEGGGGEVADAVDEDGFGQPDGAAFYEAFDMFAADEGDVVAEALAVEVEEAGAMIGFFFLHFFEDGGAGGESGAQAVGDVGVDAGV